MAGLTFGLGTPAMALPTPVAYQPVDLGLGSGYGSIGAYGANPAMAAAGVGRNLTAQKGASDMKPAGIFGADGFNLKDVGDITEIIGGFGNLLMGMQANKLAKETLAFNKNAWNTNLNNSLQSYNTNLTDRANARGAQYGQAQATTDAYIQQNALKR